MILLFKLPEYNFFNSLNHSREYGGRQDEVNKVLMEGWSWLQAQGLLIRDENANTNSFFLSRRAKKLTTRKDLATIVRRLYYQKISFIR